jgi:hypothetical protein
LQNAVAGDNINFVKIPTIAQERAAFANKTALTLFGFWGDPHQSIFGYANELHTNWHHDDSKKLEPAPSCREGPNDGSYFCLQAPSEPYKPLARVGDSGGSVTFKEDNEYYILGVISTPNYYPRLGFLNTRRWLNKFYIELHSEKQWDNYNYDYKAHIGDMYVYDDPYNNSTEYFGLMQLYAHGVYKKAYWYFPTDKKHNFYWVYLGDTDPQQSLNELDMLFSMSQWGQNDRKGKAGDIYVYVNYYTNKIEMFTLNAACTGDQRYWYFPTDASDNDCWSYDGLFSDYIKNKKSKPEPKPKFKPLFNSKIPNPFKTNVTKSIQTRVP